MTIVSPGDQVVGFATFAASQTERFTISHSSSVPADDADPTTPSSGR